LATAVAELNALITSSRPGGGQPEDDQRRLGRGLNAQPGLSERQEEMKFEITRDTNNMIGSMMNKAAWIQHQLGGYVSQGGRLTDQRLPMINPFAAPQESPAMIQQPRVLRVVNCTEEDEWELNRE